MIGNHLKWTFSIAIQCIGIVCMLSATDVNPTTGEAALAMSKSSLPAPLFTLVFDDGNDTDFTQALKIVSDEHAVACSAIVTDWIGKTGFMTANQILMLNKAGWEIMSHTVSHPNLRKLSSVEIEWELQQSKLVLQSLGLKVNNLVYPYNKSNPLVRSVASGIYRSGRGGSNNFASPSTNHYFLTSFAGHDNLKAVENQIDEACHLGKWYVVYHHRINQLVRIDKRVGTFIAGEKLIFSQSGASATFVPSAWYRMGASLWFTPIQGNARIGDQISGEMSGAKAKVIAMGIDERDYLRMLLHYVQTVHPEMQMSPWIKRSI